MKLIPDWKKAWKLSSVQGSVIGMLVMGFVEVVRETWLSLPPYIHDQIPYSNRIGFGLFLLVLILRITTSGKKDDGK